MWREVSCNETESQLNHYFSHFFFYCRSVVRNAFTTCNRLDGVRLRFSFSFSVSSLFLLRNSLQEPERVERNIHKWNRVKKKKRKTNRSATATSTKRNFRYWPWPTKIREMKFLPCIDSLFIFRRFSSRRQSTFIVCRFFVMERGHRRIYELEARAGVDPYTLDGKTGTRIEMHCEKMK